LRGRPAGEKNKSKVSVDVAPSFKSHVVEIRKGSDIVQGLVTFTANNPDDKANDPEPKISMPASLIRRILTQITYLKTSRKSTVGEAVFHSSQKTQAT